MYNNIKLQLLGFQIQDSPEIGLRAQHVSDYALHAAWLPQERGIQSCRSLHPGSTDSKGWSGPPLPAQADWPAEGEEVADQKLSPTCKDPGSGDVFRKFAALVADNISHPVSELNLFDPVLSL